MHAFNAVRTGGGRLRAVLHASDPENFYGTTFYGATTATGEKGPVKARLFKITQRAIHDATYNLSGEERFPAYRRPSPAPHNPGAVSSRGPRRDTSTATTFTVVYVHPRDDADPLQTKSAKPAQFPQTATFLWT